MSQTTVTPDVLLRVDSLLDDEERQIRDTVRALVQRASPRDIATWYETRRIARARTGRRTRRTRAARGCTCRDTAAPGTSRGGVRTGLPGAGGRRLRDPVAGQRAGIAGDVRDLHAFGSEEQKQQWLPDDGGRPKRSAASG